MNNIKEYLGIYSINDFKYELKTGIKFIVKLEWLKILLKSFTWYKENLCSNNSCEIGIAYETLYSQIEFWGLFEGIFRKILVLQPIHYVNLISHFIMCKLLVRR